MAAIIKVCLCFLLVYQTCAIKLLQFPIGALFNRERLAITEDVFYKIVNTSGRAYTGTAFLPIADDTFSTSLELCENTTEYGSIAALVDARPTEGYCDMVCMLSNIINIPHLSLGWEMPETMEKNPYTFAYHPPLELISKAYAVLIKDLKWDKFSILYEEEGSFLRLHEVINTWPHSHEPILFRKLDPDGDNKETFKHIFKVAHVSFHILDCKPRNVRKYIKEIVQVENSTQYQGFILSDLDSYTVKFDDITNWMANVSTMHLTKFNESTWTDMNIDETITVKLETALMHDALSHLEKSLRAIIPDIRGEVYNDERLPPLCYMDDGVYPVLPYGERLRNALLNTTIPNGVTGEIIFDNDRKRTKIQLYYSKLNKDSQFVSAGVWDSSTEQITYLEDTEHITERGFEEKTLIKIVSREGKPYFHEERVNDTSVVTGFAVDLIDAIFKYIKKEFKKDLKYEFYRVAGDKYGILSPETKKWNGLVGELIEHKADMAICDLTITHERNSVVDFSTPFMSLGISILFRKPDPQPTNMFSFLLPLSFDVWLYLVTTYIIVSFVLLICARMSQGDWVNPHPCNQNPENLENIWSLYNCMWLAMGTIMTQGCDILPQAPGSRWVTGMWWFFAMILTASYTANMSTFLSNSRRISDINDVKELAEQSKISYGAVYNASTYKFFEKSNETVYKKIWSVMSSAKPVVFTNNNEEGKDRVLQSKGKYAFFMESTGIEYVTAKYCDLKMVGSKLDSKEYGIAFPRNSPLKSLVDSAILHLQESLEIERIKNKWWKFDEQEGSCEERAQEIEEDDGSLQMKNTSGIFLVLGAGTFIGVIVAVIDFMMHAWKICVEEKISFVEAMASEWRASLNPRTLQKPAAPPRSAAPTESPSPLRARSQSRAVSVLRAATSFINFDEIY